jgi:hypothetical protein
VTSFSEKERLTLTNNPNNHTYVPYKTMSVLNLIFINDSQNEASKDHIIISSDYYLKAPASHNHYHNTAGEKPSPEANHNKTLKGDLEQLQNGATSTNISIAGFEVLMVVSTKMAVFWIVALCSLVEVY